MTDMAPPTAPPPLVVTLFHDLAQKALTTAAVALAAHGVIQSSQEDQVIQLGIAAGLYGLGIAWTIVSARFRTARLAAAIAAPAVPTVSPVANQN